ncbi:MAG TPA: UDP-N-acetylmuramoyl-L-alanyl-D-glutamate--2,6-diaminopimelate ligase, partial [Candidatus Baltobacteraceae bacterium]|nr:UDP-N-acetylmuramoyl-L-alanyl-D-glutamate--2,6-diaminopimelate ligase [Candidatus Baltobacteraceae bacterium]
VPKPFLQAYHWALSYLAAAWYAWPSKKMVVIGVTGTNGKTTVVNLIARILEESGEKVGLTSTVNFRIAGEDKLNDMKMTMPGRFFLQKMLHRMVEAGCRYAVIETSSQGLEQYRHLGVEYDVAVFTNLTPEHIEAHGGFENYKQAKLKLFRHLTRHARKELPMRGGIKKVSVVNLESEHAWDFLDAPADKKYGFLADGSDKAAGKATWPMAVVKALDVKLEASGSSFTVRETRFALRMPGRYNVLNALAAISVGLSQGVPLETMARALAKVDNVPGRFERIDEGQDFTVIVDYAPEPESLRQVYAAIDRMPRKRLIHVLGSAGGGRDIARRPILGRLAGAHADIAIVTNEDPYDDDPNVIIGQVAAGALETGKKEGETLFRIEDRREAIRKAVGLAGPGDVVLLTGKGAEQAIVGRGGKLTPWDERKVAREALRERLGKV